jgi:hypothetical protein
MSRSARIDAPRAGWLAGAMVATSLVAACGTAGPSQPAHTPTPAATGTQPPATSASSDPAPASPAPAPSPSTSRGPASPSPANSGAAGLAACSTASLLITVDDSQAEGAAGSTYYPLNFTNTAAKPCELYGYPGVSFVAARAGAQIGAAARRNGAFAKVAVRLTPGGTAHAWLQVTVAANYPASICQPVTARWLRVYPPGETVAGYVGHTFNACSATSTALLGVLPVRAGQARAGITP